MTSVSGGGNYMSDGAILAWLETQQDRLYGDLRESMRSSEKRAEFGNELNDIKAALHQANRSEKHDFTQVDAQMQAFMEKYAGDPDFAELCEGLQGMVDQVHRDTAVQIDAARRHQTFKEWDATAGAEFRDKVGFAAYHSMYLTTQMNVTPPQTYSDDTLKSWDELIGGKLDVVNKNDQMTMIHIQQLKASIDQGSQFGSQFIASGDKTSASIINNIA